MLSQNDEEMCVDMSGGATGSRHSSPLSVDCTQYDDVNERKLKRKQRNNKRKRRSTVLDKEGLKTGHRAAARERRKMVAVVSVFAATIFLTAVLLIVITLHMSQNSNAKAPSMGGAPENLTAGNGVQDDHSFLHDVASHLGSDTRNNRDNKTFTQHNSTSSATDKKHHVL